MAHPTGVLRTKCPTCGAGWGAHCTTIKITRSGFPTQPHRARKEAYRRLVATGKRMQEAMKTQLELCEVPRSSLKPCCNCREYRPCRLLVDSLGSIRWWCKKCVPTPTPGNPDFFREVVTREYEPKEG